jgi:hypothetical protein
MTNLQKIKLALMQRLECPTNLHQHQQQQWNHSELKKKILSMSWYFLCLTHKFFLFLWNDNFNKNNWRKFFLKKSNYFLALRLHFLSFSKLHFLDFLNTVFHTTHHGVICKFHCNIKIDFFLVNTFSQL